MRLALLICVVPFLTSVSTYFGAQETQGPICHGKPVPITLLGPKMSGPRVSFRSGGGFWEPLRLVICDRAQFSNFWKRLHSPDPTHDPGAQLPPLPEIDFSREMIVVAAMGRRPNGAYWIIIDGACEVDGQLEIFVRSINGSRCTAPAIMTAPVDVVRLPRMDLPVVFRETEVDCNQRPKFYTYSPPNKSLDRSADSLFLKLND
jgi:hypothetical protein